jgi:transposase
MPKRFRLERPELAKAVAEALAQCQNVKDQQRLLAMRLAAGGQMTSAQIAEQLGISRRQFFNWVHALKAGGVTALLEREHGGGAPARIQGPVREQLLAGLRKGQWKRAKEIQAWLKHEHQTSISLKGVYYWLGKLGGVLKVPRKTHAAKDAAQTTEFQQTLCARLKNLSVAGGKQVRIFDWTFYSQGTKDNVSSDVFIARALEFFGDAEMAMSNLSPWEKGARLARLVAQKRSLLVLDGLEPLQ